MKFVDEANLRVQAGNGGRGCAGFRREKFIPFGGPDGGDGGNGGSVILRAQEGINTLADFRIERLYKAKSGEAGSGNDRTGRSGDDLYIPVPVGTVVRDAETGEQLGDLKAAGQELKVAQGGKGGWGNTKFKTSTNRAPRQFGPGLPGEQRQLAMELKVIADVGLLGLPNAGKSTLISAVSAARPKVADYPFTTLYPNLGVVYCGQHRSFVMADIPGLIEGAAEGAGLGHRFLKHLQRTGVLLHLIDIAPVDPQADPVRDARAIVNELEQYDPALAAKPRWLVLNKRDLMPDAEAEQRAREIVKGLKFKGTVHLVSAATQRGTRELAEAVMRFLEERREAAAIEAAEASARGAMPRPTARRATRVAAKVVAKVAARNGKDAAAPAAPVSRGRPKPNVQSRKKARPQAVIKAESKARLKARAKSAAKVKAKARAKREAKGKSRANSRSRRGRA